MPIIAGGVNQSVFINRLFEYRRHIDFARHNDDARHDHHDDLDGHSHGESDGVFADHISRSERREDAECHDDDGSEQVEPDGALGFVLDGEIVFDICLFVDGSGGTVLNALEIFFVDVEIFTDARRPQAAADNSDQGRRNADDQNIDQSNARRRQHSEQRDGSRRDRASGNGLNTKNDIAGAAHKGENPTDERSIITDAFGIGAEEFNGDLNEVIHAARGLENGGDDDDSHYDHNDVDGGRARDATESED